MLLLVLIAYLESFYLFIYLSYFILFYVPGELLAGEGNLDGADAEDPRWDSGPLCQDSKGELHFVDFILKLFISNMQIFEEAP